MYLYCTLNRHVKHILTIGQTPANCQEMKRIPLDNMSWCFLCFSSNNLHPAISDQYLIPHNQPILTTTCPPPSLIFQMCYWAM